MTYAIPRSRAEVATAVQALIDEPQQPTLSALVDEVAALLPAHAHCLPYGRLIEWTTPAGLWKLEMQFRDYNAAMFTLMGPFGEWRIQDPELEHIRAVLIITGAVEEYPHA